jgi:hypothetical protein
VKEQLRKVSEPLVGQVTARERIVLVPIAIDGGSTATLATELDTTPWAI